MPATPRPHSPEDDLAFLRAIVEGGGRPPMTLAVCYLAGGLLYGLQCLFHVGQATGLIRWPDLANLAVVVGISATFLAILTWAILRDRKDGGAHRGPTASRTLSAAFSATGMANLAVIIVFGVGAWRDGDFAIWLYYASIVFALQAAAWFVAWTLKKKGWMLATALGGWVTAVALGVTVREPMIYLGICTIALFLLFALPGWILFNDARSKPA
ncbi:MAG: hypothetical protein KJ676_00825 [Alphaproteobacteria bacterium]|nr:hypothetical protein [Alphaproteobacteria bacterium]MBU1527333.1 hypothetical protein [Alphaproteobacteria bacterium]MBU2118182.1 hypothetical protein [Alphaproteobacteria bacterium]MBU2352333.1 hypothetical protein [Alphaproteobacteria bacterium]MBU2382932.1 hypothetical protein [Alphaproteobacteria bacterium]